MLLIERPGLLTTVQDQGRFGWQHLGVAHAGAADPFSLALANHLVGNKPGAAALEATFTGPAIRFTDQRLIALCGAGMRGNLNGLEVPTFETLQVGEGDLLGFQPTAFGCRMVIAVSGGIVVPPLLGSRSTDLRAGFGGLEGRALRRGDRLPLGDQDKSVKIRIAPAGLIEELYSDRPLGLLPGPESSRLTLGGQAALLGTTYRVTHQSDRMGSRLDGEPIRLKEDAHEISSAGVVTGTVQLPADGQPIVLLADHQTTGGYARIAVVAAADLPKLAQLRSGDEVRFREITHEEAIRRLKTLRVT